MTEELIGSVVEGEIINITNFGAFVSIEGKEEGLVHISEIANEFITDINNFVKIGQKVKVKVLARNKRNKLELSIKKVEKTEDGQEVPAVKSIITKAKPKERQSGFEDTLTSFIKRSEERQIDIRRNLKNKQGINKKRK